MTDRRTLNLNLATRPLRNRRLYRTAVQLLILLAVILSGLTAFIVLKYGGETARIKSMTAEARKIQAEASREERRLTADIRREEKLSQTRVDLVNAIIAKKTFRWTDMFSELEKALPGPSYITALNPTFTAGGAITMTMRVTSRSLGELLTFITNLTASGFKNIKVGGESRSEDGRLIAEIELRYERAI